VLVEENHMHHISLEVSPPLGRIEVDGDLGLVAAHDLQRAVETALSQGCRCILLDLSRVVSVDSSHVGALVRCFGLAEVEGAELKVARLSGPAGRVSVLADRMGPCDRATA
jgi:anti-anti-sigma factor